MVDFNNDTIVGIPAQDIERVLILQARNDFLIAHEHFKKEKAQSNYNDITLIAVRLQTLFLELQALLKRRLKPEEYEAMYSSIFNTKASYEDIIKYYLVINELLDSINLTKIDNKKVYDRTRVEIENKEKI